MPREVGGAIETPSLGQHALGGLGRTQVLTAFRRAVLRPAACGACRSRQAVDPGFETGGASDPSGSARVRTRAQPSASRAVAAVGSGVLPHRSAATIWATIERSVDVAAAMTRALARRSPVASERQRVQL